MGSSESLCGSRVEYKHHVLMRIIEMLWWLFSGSGLTQWPNTQYDNNTGTLATMTANYYAVLCSTDINGTILMKYGTAQYANASLADSEMAPETLPNRISASGKMIGKIIFQKSATTATAAASSFTMAFSSLGADHANLSSLDFASSGHTGFADAISGVNSNITSMTALTTLTPSTALTITGNGASTFNKCRCSNTATALNLGTSTATSLVSDARCNNANNGDFSISGNLNTPKDDYSTTGSQNNVSFGTAPCSPQEQIRHIAGIAVEQMDVYSHHECVINILFQMKMELQPINRLDWEWNLYDCTKYFGGLQYDSAVSRCTLLFFLRRQQLCLVCLYSRENSLGQRDTWNERCNNLTYSLVVQLDLVLLLTLQPHRNGCDFSPNQRHTFLPAATKMSL